jgi:peptide/nickel transport system permease protein
VRAALRGGLARAGLVMVGALALVALVGPWLVGDPREPVGVPLSPPSWAHWLGTTGQGQDVLAQTVCGARPSLALGVAVGALTVFVGAAVGATAGYFRGWVDDVLSLIINVFLVMPGLPLIVAIAAHFEPGAATTAAVLVVTGWAWSARVFRAQTMSLASRDFVAAARVSGEAHWRIVVVEIAPHMAPLLASAFIGATVYAIGAQAGLEFLGLGDVGAVTWGTQLYWARNDAALLTGSWWTFVPAGACIALAGFGLVLLNGAVDELGNPRLRVPAAYRKALRAAGLRLGGPTPVLREGRDAR